MVARGLFSAYTNNPERKVSAKIIEVFDEEVIKTFLMVNFAGKPMSQEHLDYAQKINDKISS